MLVLICYRHSISVVRPAGIRLAGATSDVHIMDVRSGKWEQVVPQGEPPSPRAAHAAAAVGSMVVIQGGIGPAGLASEDLHVLDFTEFDRPRWHRCDSALGFPPKKVQYQIPISLMHHLLYPQSRLEDKVQAMKTLLRVPKDIASNTLANASSSEIQLTCCCQASDVWSHFHKS